VRISSLDLEQRDDGLLSSQSREIKTTQSSPNWRYLDKSTPTGTTGGAGAAVADAGGAIASFESAPAGVPWGVRNAAYLVVLALRAGVHVCVCVCVCVCQWAQA
jgi:hypothetical protein